MALCLAAGKLFANTKSSPPNSLKRASRCRASTLMQPRRPRWNLPPLGRSLLTGIACAGFGVFAARRRERAQRSEPAAAEPPAALRPGAAYSQAAWLSLVAGGKEGSPESLEAGMHAPQRTEPCAAARGTSSGRDAAARVGEDLPTGPEQETSSREVAGKRRSPHGPLSLGDGASNGAGDSSRGEGHSMGESRISPPDRHMGGHFDTAAAPAWGMQPGPDSGQFGQGIASASRHAPPRQALSDQRKSEVSTPIACAVLHVNRHR